MSDISVNVGLNPSDVIAGVNAIADAIEETVGRLGDIGGEGGVEGGAGTELLEALEGQVNTLVEGAERLLAVLENVAGAATEVGGAAGFESVQGQLDAISAATARVTELLGTATGALEGLGGRGPAGLEEVSTVLSGALGDFGALNGLVNETTASLATLGSEGVGAGALTASGIRETTTAVVDLAEAVVKTRAELVELAATNPAAAGAQIALQAASPIEAAALLRSVGETLSATGSGGERVSAVEQRRLLQRGFYGAGGESASPQDILQEQQRSTNASRLDRISSEAAERDRVREENRARAATPEARTTANNTDASESAARAADQAYIASTVEAATNRNLEAAAVDAAKAADDDYVGSVVLAATNHNLEAAAINAAKAADEEYVDSTALAATERAALAAAERAALAANEAYIEATASAQVSQEQLAAAVKEAANRYREQAGLPLAGGGGAAGEQSAVELSTQRNLEAAQTAANLAGDRGYLDSTVELATQRARQATLEAQALAANEQYILATKEAAAAKKALAGATGQGGGGGGGRGGGFGLFGGGGGIGQSLNVAAGFAEAQVFFQLIGQLQGAIKEAIDFQDALTRIQVVLNQTGQANSFGTVEAGLLTISENANIAASSLTGPFIQAQAVFGGATNGLVALSNAAELSKISGDSLASSMQNLVVISSVYGITANNLGQINDTLFGAFERYGTPITDLASALKNLGDTGASAGFSLSYLTDLLGKASQLSGSNASTEGSLAARALTGLPDNEAKILEFARANGITNLTTSTFDKGGQAVFSAVGGAIDSGQLSPAQQLEITRLIGGGGRVAPAILPLLQAAGVANNDQSINDTGKAAAAFAAQMGDLKESFGRAETTLKDVVSFGLIPMANAAASVLGPLDQLVQRLTQISSIKIPGAGGTTVGQVVQEANYPELYVARALGNRLFGGGGGGGSNAGDRATSNETAGNANFIAGLGGLLDDTSLSASNIKAIQDALNDPTNKAKLDAAAKIFNDAAKTKGGQSAEAAGVAAAIQAAQDTELANVQTAQGLFDAGQLSVAAFQAVLTKDNVTQQQILDDQKSSTAAKAAAATQLASNQREFATLLADQSGLQISEAQVAFQQSPDVFNPVARANEAILEAGLKVQAAAQEQGPNAAKDFNDALAAYYKALNDFTQAQLTQANALQEAIDQYAVSAATNTLQADAAKLKADQDKLSLVKANPASTPADVQNQQNQIAADTVAQIQNARADALTLATSQFGLQTAQTHGDPVAAAQVALAQANADLARAQGETGLVDPAVQQADINNALAKQIQAGDAISKAENSLLQSRFALLEALAKAAGNDVLAAREALQAAQSQLASDLKTGLGGPQQIQADEAAVVNARAQVAATIVSTSETRIQDQLDLRQITIAQAVAELKALETVTTDQNTLLDLRVRIHDLLANTSNLTIDIPSDINLPGLYQARRFAQTPAGVGYADNRNFNINLNILGQTDFNNALGTVVEAVGGPTSRSYGTGTKIY